MKKWKSASCRESKNKSFGVKIVTFRPKLDPTALTHDDTLLTRSLVFRPLFFRFVFWSIFESVKDGDRCSELKHKKASKPREITIKLLISN